MLSSLAQTVISHHLAYLLLVTDIGFRWRGGEGEQEGIRGGEGGKKEVGREGKEEEILARNKRTYSDSLNRIVGKKCLGTKCKASALIY